MLLVRVLLFIAPAALTTLAFAQSNSPWYVLAYGGRGEMHGPPTCHPLAFFSASALPLDFDSDFFQQKPSDLKTTTKFTLLGAMNGRRVYKAMLTVNTHHRPDIKVLLVERHPGEFCDIYQHQYAYDPTAEMDEAAILNISGRKVLKTYETDMHTSFLEYWAMDKDGPVRLNTAGMYVAIEAASPVGAVPFRRAVNLSGSHQTEDIYSAEEDHKTLGKVDLDLSVQGDKIVVLRKRWTLERDQ
jgi:hypothetical protein